MNEKMLTGICVWVCLGSSWQMLTLASHRHFLATAPTPAPWSYLSQLTAALELGCWEWVGAGACGAARRPPQSPQD